VTNAKLNKEFVTLKNTGTTSRNLTGWTVEDLAGHVYTFGSFTLRPGWKVAFIQAKGRTLQPTGLGAGAIMCGTTPVTRLSCTIPVEPGRTHALGVMAQATYIADIP
jgi:hypothetical protein